MSDEDDDKLTSVEVVGIYFAAFVLMPIVLLGWLVFKATCAMGFHLWAYRPRLHVPFYGTGHHQCLQCSTIKVRPT